MTELHDPRIRFRVWVAGQLVEETWVDVSNPEAEEHMAAASDRHRALTELADAQDQPWLVEWWDPEQDTYGRVGTDGNGMVDPRPMTEESVQNWLQKYNG